MATTKRGPSLGPDDKVLDQFLPTTLARQSDIAAALAGFTPTTSKGTATQTLYWNGSAYVGVGGETYQSGYGLTIFAINGPDPLTIFPGLTDRCIWRRVIA
jgi:hypothetical protein